MIVSRRPRTFLSLVLAVAAIWTTMVTVTEATATTAMHCHSVPMPCCPPNSAGAAHCLASQCFVQMPQKAERGIRTLVAQGTGVSLTVVPRQFPAPANAPMSSARGRTGVFRLKDDLRV